MPDRNRRQFLKIAASTGAISTLGFAGYLGEDGGDGGDGSDSGDGGDDENYPEEEINVIIPFGAGGGTDSQYRGIQNGFKNELSVSTVPDNQPGASGRTGMNDLWRMDGDGYNIGCISGLTSTMGQVLYDTEYDLREGGSDRRFNGTVLLPRRRGRAVRRPGRPRELGRRCKRDRPRLRRTRFFRRLRLQGVARCCGR